MNQNNGRLGNRARFLRGGCGEGIRIECKHRQTEVEESIEEARNLPYSKWPSSGLSAQDLVLRIREDNCGIGPMIFHC